MPPAVRRPSTSAVAVVLLASACTSGPADGSAGADDPVSEDGAAGEDTARVVTLDPYVTQPTAALLGAEVVGRATPAFDAPILTFLDDEERARLGGAVDVGWLEIDLETVASLAPDHVVTTEAFVEGDLELVARLEEVTEVRMVPVDYHDDWRGAVVAAAEQLGDDDGRARDGIDELDGRIAGLRSTIEDAGYSASLLNVRGADDVRLYTASCGTSLLDDLGFARPGTHPTYPEDDINLPISIERLPEADADVVFTFVGSTGTDPASLDRTATDLEATPLYAQLGAVEAGRAHLVDADHWFGCGSLQAAEAIVADVERFAAGW